MANKNLTDDEVLAELKKHGSELLEMLETYERSRWMGRLLWKCGIVLGGAAAGAVAFKQNILTFIGKG